MEKYLTASATELADRIRRRDTLAENVVRAHVEHAQRVNPGLNAIVAPRYDQAMQEAKEVDERIAGGEELGPFAGVPGTIKECFAWEGMPNTSGLKSRIGVTPEENATAVKRMLATDCVPLGSTNLSELCMWMESDNHVYGRTNNPYNPAHIVGGSSGGEGAIIGSGASVFGLGSDVGGSIRMPAFFNGVYGHKPSGGLIPGTGQYPIAHHDALRYLTTGPLCRRAEDLWPLVNVLAGPDGMDTGCREFHLGKPDDVRVKDLKIVNIAWNGKNKVDQELQQAQQNLADGLAAAGAEVVNIQPQMLRKSFDIWSAMLGSAEPTGVFRGNMQRSIPALLWELLKLPFGLANHTFPAILLGLTEDITELMPGYTEKMIAMGRELQQEMQQALDGETVFLYPGYTRPAPRHNAPLLHFTDFVYTAIWNVMEFPVTQIPLGLSKAGLPLGVQVGADIGGDHRTVAIARWAEQNIAGWTPPWNSK